MSEWISFNRTESQPLILLPTLLNGKGPFDFVLDTGASMTTITEEIALIAGIEKTGVKEALGAGGTKMSVALGKVSSMAVGENHLEDIQVGIMKELPRCAGYGALGYNFLKGFILTIDYRASQLTLASQQNPTSDWWLINDRVPFRLASPDRPILLVDVRINDQEIIPFILDTGASHTIVSPELAQQVGLEGHQSNPVLGAGGAVPASMGRLGSLALGEARSEQVPVIIADIFSGLRQALTAPFEGILGDTFLRHYTLEINYSDSFIRLKS